MKTTAASLQPGDRYLDRGTVVTVVQVIRFAEMPGRLTVIGDRGGAKTTWFCNTQTEVEV